MFAAQRTVSTVPATEQSVLPTLRGIPWWGAVAVATGVTALGAAIDAINNNGLGSIFKFCYLVGCVAAALLVRRRALFTAAVQPPLVAFAVGVITLYTLNAEQASSGLKSLIFQVLIPVANIFPWLAITFVLTLAIVVGRWYITRKVVPTTGESDAAERDASPRKRSARTSSRRSTDERTATATRSARPPSARPTRSASTTSAASSRDSSRTERPDSARSATERSATERAPRERATRDGDSTRRRSASGERHRSRQATSDTAARRRPRPDDSPAASRATTGNRSASGARAGARATAGQLYRAEAGRPVEEIQPAEPATEAFGINPTERR